MSKNRTMRACARTALALAAVALFAASAGIAQTAEPELASRAVTRTTLTAETRKIAGRSILVYEASVDSEDGSPATGSVSILEQSRTLAGAALDADGKAEIRFDALSAADHTLRAVYSGDALHAASRSEAIQAHPEATAPAFAFSIAVPGSTTTPPVMNIAAPGDSSDLTATVTPTGGFTGFISLSCSGPPATSGAPGGTNLPVGVSCTFTPLNLEISTANPVSADMTLITTKPQSTVGSLKTSPAHTRAPLALALLLPGIAAIGFAARRRKLWMRAAMLLFVGALTLLGTTACNPRYNYLNHGPTFAGTLPGTYVITVTAQTSNGVTASSTSLPLTLVVK